MKTTEAEYFSGFKSDRKFQKQCIRYLDFGHFLVCSSGWGSYHFFFWTELEFLHESKWLFLSPISDITESTSRNFVPTWRNFMPTWRNFVPTWRNFLPTWSTKKLRAHMEKLPAHIEKLRAYMEKLCAQVEKLHAHMKKLRAHMEKLHAHKEKFC